MSTNFFPTFEEVQARVCGQSPEETTTVERTRLAVCKILRGQDKEIVGCGVLVCDPEANDHISGLSTSKYCIITSKEVIKEENFVDGSINQVEFSKEPRKKCFDLKGVSKSVKDVPSGLVLIFIDPCHRDFKHGYLIRKKCSILTKSPLPITNFDQDQRLFCYVANQCYDVVKSSGENGEYVLKAANNLDTAVESTTPDEIPNGTVILQVANRDVKAVGVFNVVDETNMVVSPIWLKSSISGILADTSTSAVGQPPNPSTGGQAPIRSTAGSVVSASGTSSPAGPSSNAPRKNTKAKERPTDETGTTKGSEASRLNQETKEQRDETDDAISDFKTLLQDIRLAAEKGFQDLKEKCTSIKLPALQMAKEEDFFWNELQFDWTSQELLPLDKGTMYRALNTTADGNCFFRTASIFAFGNEHNHEEMRVRTVIELACNSDFYLEGEDIERMLIAEAQALEGEAPDLHSNKGGPTSILGPEALRGIFESEVQHSTRERFWACHWHLQALATVLNRQVGSVYPEGGGKEIKKYLNTVILPRCCDKNIEMEEPVAVMWTQTTISDPFKPNHFVPLIPVNKIPPSKSKDPPTRKLNDPPLPSEEDYKSLPRQNGPPSVPLRGPIYQESEEAGKVRSELKRVNEDSLVKEIIYGNPFVLDELSLKLDSAPVKKSGLTGYWPHFAYRLGVSDETKMRCQKRSNYKPSLMMFTHLLTKSPDFTVNNLEYHLEKIKRGTLVSMLKKSSVKGTERLTVLSQRDWKTFHDICLYLDCSNMYNWQDLSAQMNIPLDIFEKCKRPEEYFEFALRIIYTRRPNLSVKEMKAALEDMDRNDVLEELKVLPGGSDIKTLLERYDVLQEVSRLLEKETPQNWQVFAQKFGVSKEECDYLCPEDCHSPTEALMEYLSADKEDLTLQTFIEALLQIPREDVVNSLKTFFNPFDIDHIVNNIRLRGLGSNTNELEKVKQTNSWKLIQVSSESDIL